jgi:hypothetical protein
VLSVLESASPETASYFRALVRQLNGCAPDRTSWHLLLEHSSAVDGTAFLNTLLDASTDADTMSRLADSYDEKEGCIRLRLAQAPGLSVRLHIWTPPAPGQEPYLENVHGHRRYMSSLILTGSYISDDYEYDEADAELTMTGRRVLRSGSSYVIAPQTVHAIANPYAEHCVTLIFRGDVVTDRILVFDKTSGAATAHISQRPVAQLARTEEQQRMSRAEYLRWRLDRIRDELATAAT